MSMIGRLIDKLLTKGSSTIIEPGKPPATYGPGGHGGKDLTVRLTDNKVLWEIVRNPRLGLGESYMDGRLLIENGDILDLLDLVMSSNPWEDGKQERGILVRGKSGLRWLLRRNNPRQSKRNVALHYVLGDELYETFLDSDRQYS